MDENLAKTKELANIISNAIIAVGSKYTHSQALSAITTNIVWLLAVPHVIRPKETNELVNNLPAIIHKMLQDGDATVRKELKEANR